MLHRHQPHVIDYVGMTHEQDPIKRLRLVFNRAYHHLSIPKLMDPEDLVNSWWQEERCILTLVVTWYRWLNDAHLRKRYADRLTKMLDKSLTTSHMIEYYMKRVTWWREWTEKAICSLRRIDNLPLLADSNAPNIVYFTSGDAQDWLKQLSHWRQTERAGKLIERGNLEVCFLGHHVMFSRNSFPISLFT